MMICAFLLLYGSDLIAGIRHNIMKGGIICILLCITPIEKYKCLLKMQHENRESHTSQNYSSTTVKNSKCYWLHWVTSIISQGFPRFN